MQKRQATNEDVYLAVRAIVCAVLAIPPFIFSVIDPWPYVIPAALCLYASGYFAGKIVANEG